MKPTFSSQAYHLNEWLAGAVKRGDPVTKAEIAAALGVLPQQVCQWFAGTIPVSIKYIDPLSTYFAATIVPRTSVSHANIALALKDSLVEAISIDYKYRYLEKVNEHNRQTTGTDSSKT